MTEADRTSNIRPSRSNGDIVDNVAVPECTLHSWASEAQAENVSYRLDDFTTSATGPLRLTLKLTKQTECGSMSRSRSQMPLRLTKDLCSNPPFSGSRFQGL
ncbi:hypothetical protein BDV09DRAFT_164888 [Aspergillus tetrazonus]